MKQIAALYRIETDIRGQNPEARLAARQERSAPRIKAFEEWLREHRGKVSRKSPLGEALKYIAKIGTASACFSLMAVSRWTTAPSNAPFAQLP